MARVAYVYGKRLAEAREGLAMTQLQFANVIGGVSDETVSRVERNEVAGILAKRLPAMATALGLGLEEFKSRFCASPAEAVKAGIATAGGLPIGLDMRRIRFARVLPEFRIGIAASRRVDKVSEHPDTNRLVATADRRAFTAPVDGDCQHPKWKDGEVVVFSYDAVEREGILPGRSYYLAFTDGSTTFKRVFNDENDPDALILRCWNRRKFPHDQRVHRDEVVRIARAISKQVVVEEDES